MIETIKNYLSKRTTLKKQAIFTALHMSQIGLSSHLRGINTNRPRLICASTYNNKYCKTITNTANENQTS